MSLVLPAGEMEAAQAVYDFLRDAGHLDCGAWSQTLGDPSGVITCACRATLRPFRPGPQCTCVRGNDMTAATTSIFDCLACSTGRLDRRPEQ